MKLEKLYKKAIRVGIANDLRGKAEITKNLKEEKEKFDSLKKDEIAYYDKDRLFNPFADTRILYGNPDLDVKKVIIGIDMEVGEILLTHILNSQNKENIDLIISHHPEGYALAQLHDVMKLQADLMAAYGVNISVAEQLMEKRIAEVQRRLLPVNHTRAVDAARVLGIPMMCIHTPADNCVTNHLQKTFATQKPYKLKDLMHILKTIPEYKRSAMQQVPPKIVNGSENNKCGKIYVDMTGGTEGAKEILEKYANTGISTLVGMHFSEEHLDNAKKANLNVVIAGHVSSDVIGLNLLFDEIEKEEKLEFVGVSGFERIKRTK
jgi:putative NIF3 family GTP cyclohydrolase 1 type 2